MAMLNSQRVPPKTSNVQTVLEGITLDGAHLTTRAPVFCHVKQAWHKTVKTWFHFLAYQVFTHTTHILKYKWVKDGWNLVGPNTTDICPEDCRVHVASGLHEHGLLPSSSQPPNPRIRFRKAHQRLGCPYTLAPRSQRIPRALLLPRYLRKFQQAG